MQQQSSASFSPESVAILRNADRRIRSADRGDMTRRYAAVKAALAGLAPLDAFYIAYFRGERSVVLSYIFDGDQRLASEMITANPGGVAHWVRSSGKPYLYSDDDGRMLHRGAPLGDAATLSSDCVFTPLIDPDTGDPAGMISSQSEKPNIFSEEFVRAQTWLGAAMMASISHDGSVPGDALYEVYPELDSERVRNEADLLNRIGERLDDLGRQLASLHALALESGQVALSTEAARGQELCDRVQTEVVELVRTYQPPVVTSDLTAREAEIAVLIARDGLTNAQLAASLHISEKTVKTHVGNVLRKLGVTQRAAIAWTLPPELLARVPEPKTTT
ncbi:helix-turn-helix transcriptional regulator [Dermacoccaceae bacterium W4C1]